MLQNGEDICRDIEDLKELSANPKLVLTTYTCRNYTRDQIIEKLEEVA